MTSSSHLAGAAVFYLVYCALTEDAVSIEGLAATAAGSLLPDIDTPTSSIGRPLFPLARRINEKLGHRTATHSLLGVVVFALAAAGLEALARATGLLAPDGFPAAVCLTLGYLSHVLIDTVNKTGVELFWPSRLRCVFFLNERYRIAAGGAGDYWFMVGALILALAMYPVAREVVLWGTVALASGQTAPPEPLWTGSAGAGVALTGGNSDTANYNLTVDLKRDPKTRNLMKY